MTWLLFGLGWLRKAFSAFLDLCTRYPLQVAMCASLAANMWLWRGWDREQEGRAADRAAYVKAQKDAKAKQDQHDREDLAAQVILTRQVEQAHAQNETNLRAALDEYARTHRLRPQAARCPASGAGQAGVPSDPGPPPEAPAEPDMVAISRADLDAIAAKAMRDSEWQQLGDAWIKEGRAIKASELPSPAF